MSDRSDTTGAAPTTRFTHEAFTRVWDSLTDEEREDIKAKARWEHMSLSAVMKCWWPELWQQVVA